MTYCCALVSFRSGRLLRGQRPEKPATYLTVSKLPAAHGRLRPPPAVSKTQVHDLLAKKRSLLKLLSVSKLPKGPWQTAVTTSCQTRPRCMTLQTSAVGPAIHRKFALSGGQAAHRKGTASHTLADRMKKRSTRGSRYPGPSLAPERGASHTLRNASVSQVQRACRPHFKQRLKDMSA